MLEKLSQTDLNQELDRLIGLFQAGKIEELLSEINQLLNQFPRSIALLNLKGISYSHLRNFKEAIKVYKKAVQIDPENPITCFNLGVALYDNGQLKEALANYLLAVRLKPDYVQALFNTGIIFEEMKLMSSAVSYYKKALALNPSHGQTILKLGKAQVEIGEIKAAEINFRKGFNANSYFSAYKFDLGTLLSNYGQYDEGLEVILTSLKQDVNSIEGHNTLLFIANYSSSLSAEVIYSYYKRFDDLFSKKFKNKWPKYKTVKEKKKLKIGYVSSDFHRTSLSLFLEPIFIHHDRDQFEVYSFVNSDTHDYITSSIKSHCDGWIPTEELNSQDMASKIHELGIDILIDLAGHTRGNRLDAFMYKPAPISLSWWIGFGYTTGLSSIDYFLADPTLVPEGSEHLFAEEVWKMNYPCSSVYRPDPTMGSVNPLPALTNGFITFGSLTRSIRLNDRVINTWSKILKKVPYSKLIIDSNGFQHREVREIFIKKFEENGITKDRLEIGCHSPPWDTLRKIDIGLDCFPHNSGTTLVEHLYMGNPYITLADRPSVGRIGSHYLKGVGHSEWIAHSEEEYVEKACMLSSNLQDLSKIRDQLRSEMENSPLCDEKAFVKQLENTYQLMWEKYLKKVT